MISFATEPAFTPALPAHSFQAPTLIGCQIFKEQGTRPTHCEFCTAFSATSIISLSRFVSEAEKRDYEGLFRHCQIDILLFYSLMTVRHKHEKKFSCFKLIDLKRLNFYMPSQSNF